MEINLIGQLYDLIKERGDNPISVYLNKDYEKEWYFSGDYYIEDNITFFELTDDKNKAINCKQIIETIEREALDKCWNEIGYNCYNSYQDCELRLAFFEDYSSDIKESNLIYSSEFTSECNDYYVYLYAEKED